MGLCAGGFAAAAVSTSQTLAELIPAGVEAVLTAFRTALYTLAVRNDVEEPNHGIHHQSWSAVVNIQEYEASELIKRFILEKVSDDGVILNHDGLIGANINHLSRVSPTAPNPI